MGTKFRKIIYDKYFKKIPKVNKVAIISNTYDENIAQEIFKIIPLFKFEVEYLLANCKY